jgi:hypothetical protein
MTDIKKISGKTGPNKALMAMIGANGRDLRLNRVYTNRLALLLAVHKIQVPCRFGALENAR